MEWYKVIIEPDNGGCGGIIGFICLIIVVGLIAGMCAGSNNSGTKQPVSTSYETIPFVEETKPEVCGIVSLRQFDTVGSVTIYRDNIEDSYGNKYQGPYLRMWSMNNRSDDESGYISSVEFATGGYYNYFSGTYFCTKMNNDQSIEFFIYADDILVYSSGVINNKTKAKKFNININHCDVLKIQTFTTDYHYGTNNPSDVFFVDLKVSK